MYLTCLNHPATWHFRVFYVNLSNSDILPGKLELFQSYKSIIGIKCLPSNKSKTCDALFMYLTCLNHLPTWYFRVFYIYLSNFDILLGKLELFQSYKLIIGIKCLPCNKSKTCDVLYMYLTCLNHLPTWHFRVFYVYLSNSDILLGKLALFQSYKSIVDVKCLPCNQSKNCDALLMCLNCLYHLPTWHFKVFFFI